MALSTVIALAVASTIVSAVTMIGAIWLAARVWQVPAVSWGRAALATLWLTLGNWFLLAALLFVVLKLDLSHDNNLGLAALAVATTCAFALLVFGIGRPLRIGAVKAICVGLTAIAAESVIALVLALGCRGQLLEAFVMPTGSMAPTIYGDHFDLTCPNCGNQFAANASHRLDQRQRLMDDEVAICGNCLAEIPIAREQPVAKGDRFLVDKTVGPRRWDCVVFREPSEGRVNYVKRVVGLPGETVTLLNGELVVDGRTVRKHPRQQTDLWFQVYDSHFLPRERDMNMPGWQPAENVAAWKACREGRVVLRHIQRSIRTTRISRIDRRYFSVQPRYRGGPTPIQPPCW